MDPWLRRLARALSAFVLLPAVLAPAQANTAGSALAQLCDSHWQATLDEEPVWATSIGVRRHDARLPDLSPAGIERRQARLDTLLARARAIAVSDLTAEDRVTRAALLLDAQDRLDALSCRYDEWLVDSFDGPHIALMNLAEVTAIETPAHAADYVLRCRAAGAYLDQHIANLQRGIAARRYPTASVVRKTLRQLSGIVRLPIETFPLLRPLEAPRADWPAGAQEEFRAALTAAVRDSVLPGLERYRDFLDRVMLRVARSDERAGLSYVPGGAECYRRQIRIQSSLDLSPQQLHRIGQEQVALVRKEIEQVGARVFGTTDMIEIQRRLRDEPSLRFATEEQVEARARASLARARKALPRWFRMVPKAKCEVRVLAGAGPSTIAFYRPPVPDGSRPAYYLIGTSGPTSRRRFEAEALAFHEAIPGHHVQVAIAQERASLPEFRRHQRVTAFAEGWALYAERLADEMGLYTDDLDRLGMLSYDAWRSCRLVVDTGLHALGWSVEEAADYMTRNSMVPTSEIYDDLERCLSWPGQALAYKVGQIEILRLREEARRRLGRRFDIRDFHDAVLGQGAVALPLLREQVERYVARVEGKR